MNKHRIFKRRELLQRTIGVGVGLSPIAGLSGCVAPHPEVSPESSAFGDKALSRVAFGSCIDQNRPQPIWSAITAVAPELFIFGGDNVYASGAKFQISDLSAAYAKLESNLGFSQFSQSTPHLAIWDDHDYGFNDGGAYWPFKQAAKDEFLKFWKVAASDERHQREGLYFSRLFGPSGKRTQIIVLDTRWNKSPWRITDQRNAPGKERYLPDNDPNKTMLGETQWQWLEKQLRIPAKLRLIVSGLQVVTLGHGWESWALFPLEKARLFTTIARAKANGVVFISGDRHIGAMYCETTATPYPFYEITSSGMTHAWAQASEAGPNRLGDLVTQNHFGLCDMAWDTGTITLSLQTEDGKTAQRRTISLKELNL